MLRSFGLVKRAALWSLLILIAATASITAGELVLRLRGFGPWRKMAVYASAPITTMPDPQLGWVNQPGDYLYPVHGADRPPVRITILPDGARGHAPAVGATPDIAVFGCSFAHGWGVGDDEAFPALLQRMEKREVANYGVVGYGTLQSFLLWKRQSGNGRMHPRVVVYGFLDHHVERNVAPPEWLHVLAAIAKHDERLAIPFAYLDGAGGRLAIAGPVRYPRWPLREHLALVSFLQDRYAQLEGGHRRD